MTQGDCHRIGSIVRLGRLREPQNPLGHIHHLMLGGISVANHRLLYLHGLVLGNLQTRLPDSKENHTPALGHTDAGGDILTEK